MKVQVASGPFHPGGDWSGSPPPLATDQFVKLSSFFQGNPGNDGLPGNPGLPGYIVSNRESRRRQFFFFCLERLLPFFFGSFLPHWCCKKHVFIRKLTK